MSSPSRLVSKLTAVLVWSASLGAAACGDAEGARPSTPTRDADVAFTDMTGQDEVVVQARDNTFVAQHVTVSAGTEITFDNRGRNPHNAIAVEENAFTEVPTEDLQPGDQVPVVFDEPGEYPYYCTLHGTETAGMIGTIRVEDR